MPAPGQASSLSLEGCPAPSSVSLACLHTAWMGLKLPLPCSPALNFSFCPGLNPSTKPGTCFRACPSFPAVHSASFLLPVSSAQAQFCATYTFPTVLPAPSLSMK